MGKIKSLQITNEEDLKYLLQVKEIIQVQLDMLEHEEYSVKNRIAEVKMRLAEVDQQLEEAGYVGGEEGVD